MIARRIEPARRSRGERRDRDPLFDRYLERLREVLELWDAPPAAVAEILGEIGSHVAEARREGRVLSEILRGLGPPDELAEAYGAALLLDRARGSRSHRARILRAAGGWLQTVTTSALLALLLIASVALCALGALGSAAALVLPALPAELLEPTLRAGAPQVVVLAISALTLILGAQGFRWLRVNVRLARTVLWRRRRPTGLGCRSGGGAGQPRVFPAPVEPPARSGRAPAQDEGEGEGEREGEGVGVGVGVGEGGEA